MRMKIVIAALLVSFSLLAAGCTSREVYENTRSHERQKCNRMPSGSERDECLQRTSEEYDAYKRKREDALKR
jgi:hypothetical protein